MLYFTLNDGHKIPAVGSGTNTYGKENKDYSAPINMDTTELASAIALGYRHFDTAISYRNESVVAKAIRESGLDRSEFYITSKIPGEPEFYASEEATRRGVEQSLEALDTDYIDLYLIHHPWDNNEEILAMWRLLESYVDAGKLKSIGVSNFDEKQLGYLLEHGRIKPAVNQIQSNPNDWNDEIIRFSSENGVYPEAWGPVRGIKNLESPELAAIAAKYGKSPSQVIFRYQLDRGVIIIPKSHNAERQAENLDLFDFTLTEDERATIAAL